MRQHYAPHNRSEESHRRTDRHILFTSVVGYFAYAQYDVLFLVVIAKERSDCGNPLEKARSVYFVDLHPPGSLLRSARKDGTMGGAIVRWDISLTLNMT